MLRPSASDIALGETVVAESSFDRDDGELPRGSSLSRYVILGRLGSGGMGIVYAAHDPELDRRIALKVLRHAGDSEVGAVRRTRLLREAQAMARINHPNVIAVHDVGAVGNRVFVAMELIEGVTLDVWLAQRDRTSAEVVAAFVQAGRGLAAAHAKGLVHRDFKPENALMGTDGGVRVLDFGLAQAEGSPSVDSLPPDGPVASSDALGSVPPATSSGRLSDPLTRVGALVGTPWYMSPEQLRGKRADARSDQWSLAAALHEGLFGEHPFACPEDLDVQTLRLRMDAGARREVPPATLARVTPRVRAALSRALAIDPKERFPSVADFISALEPPPSRSRWLVASLLGAAVLAGAVGVYAVRARVASKCEATARDLDGVWDPARKGEVASAFTATGRPFAAAALDATIKALDSYATDWLAMERQVCEATFVRGVQSTELHDLRMQCLSARRTELRAIGDVLARADADVVARAPAASRALSSLDTCANVAALRSPTTLPSDGPARAAVVAVRARVAKARALEAAGRYPDMLIESKGAVTDAQSLAFLPARAEAAAMLGRAQYFTADAKSAEPTLIDALVDAEASRDDWEAAETWSMVLEVQTARYEFERADESSRHAAASIARIGGDAELEAQLERVRAELDRHRSRYDDSATHARQALALHEKRYGDRDPRIARDLVQLSVTLNLQGKYQEAVANDERALSIVESSLGADHPEVASICNTLSQSYEYMGAPERALEYGRRSLGIRERAFGRDHAFVASSLLEIGNAQGDLGDFDGAIDSYRRALGIYQATTGPDSPDAAAATYDIAVTYTERHDFANGLAYAQKALAMREKTLGPDHTDVATALQTVAENMCELGRCADALPLMNRALAILAKGFGRQHADYASVLIGLGMARRKLGQYRAAEDALEEGLRTLDAVDTSDLARGAVRYELAQTLWDGKGDRTRAIVLARAARDYYARGTNGGGEVAEVDGWLGKHSR
jgi:tetratricopeptide (TPR) repeat protein